MNKLFLGLDTSNYTTSAALCDENGKILANIKKPLFVAEGERGLRQSDSVFAHLKNMTDVSKALREALGEEERSEISAVGYSASPCDGEDSYMPCFVTGGAVARMTAAALGVCSYAFSHQAGHITAALYGADKMPLINEKFAAFHVSGGTTDILLVKPGQKRIITIEKLGSTLDLNAGQVIDRAGVMIGLSFPAGPALEAAASEYEGEIVKYKTSVRELECNLSGIENKAKKLYADTGDKSAAAAFVINAVADTLYGLTVNLREKYPDIPIVFAGGVMSCKLIKRRLSGFGAFFADGGYSSDNAAGIALLARESYMREAEN